MTTRLVTLEGCSESVGGDSCASLKGKKKVKKRRIVSLSLSLSLQSKSPLLTLWRTAAADHGCQTRLCDGLVQANARPPRQAGLGKPEAVA